MDWETLTFLLHRDWKIPKCHEQEVAKHGKNVNQETKELPTMGFRAALSSEDLALGR